LVDRVEDADDIVRRIVDRLDAFLATPRLLVMIIRSR
jgi:hypothetical protein